jgi:hypothetical protein
MLLKAQFGQILRAAMGLNARGIMLNTRGWLAAILTRASSKALATIPNTERTARNMQSGLPTLRGRTCHCVASEMAMAEKMLTVQLTNLSQVASMKWPNQSLADASVPMPQARNAISPLEALEAYRRMRGLA